MIAVAQPGRAREFRLVRSRVQIPPASSQQHGKEAKYHQWNRKRLNLDEATYWVIVAS